MNQPIDLDVLEALARKATPGPWWVSQIRVDGTARIVTTAKGFRVQTVGGDDSANADFIAAVNPEIVLALVAELKAARDALVVIGREVLDGKGELTPEVRAAYRRWRESQGKK